ncbi:MAG TPA: exodeoxyribonuclease VII small subunit [Deltaproteobacteria bacterium]|nr:exodeoxyribonuclease VII small subunit [Deltaproteobacteria bacterium]HPR53810.1 exodeoxyribonuclease VII small subunit [Deltaproteobacteria bacterium]HXK45990.1 exodeoxyribonuclease VII small subunit [Deltaproteobacteria bacterium]
MTEMKKTKGYSDILRELEEMLEKMNRGDIPIDDLEDTIKSAAGKIRYLKDRLRATEAEITKVLKDIEGDSEGDAEDR